jgi:hypothetical protein
MASKRNKNVFKTRSIIGFLIGLVTALVIIVVSNHYLQGIESVFVQRVILGGILFIGYASAACLLVSPFPQMERGELKLLAEEGKQGKVRFIIDEVFSGNFKWYVLAIITFLLIRDYFRETSMLNNLGLYSAIILIFVFVRLRFAFSYWNEIEKAYKSLIK